MTILKIRLPEGKGHPGLLAGRQQDVAVRHQSDIAGLQKIHLNSVSRYLSENATVANVLM